MNEWGVVGVLIAIVGLVVTVAGPMIKVSSSLTKVTTILASETGGLMFVTLAEGGQIDEVTAEEQCLTAHTSQDDWGPDVAPSLWVGISDPAEEWPAWSQPVGATDAYILGAKVTHEGKHWTSTVDNNVWEPGAYGWSEVTENGV